MVNFAFGALLGVGAGLFGGAILAITCIEPHIYAPAGLAALLLGFVSSIVLLLRWLDKAGPVGKAGTQTKSESAEGSPY